MPFCEQFKFQRCAVLPGNLLERFLTAACPVVWALPARRGCVLPLALHHGHCQLKLLNTVPRAFEVRVFLYVHSWKERI